MDMGSSASLLADVTEALIGWKWAELVRI